MLRRILPALALLAGLLLPLEGGDAQGAGQASRPFTITVTTTPVVTVINLSTTVINTPDANNANAVVAGISLTTQPLGAPFTGKISVGGVSAPSFALAALPAVGGCAAANGVLACTAAPTCPAQNCNNVPLGNLVLGAANVPAGQYPIIINAGP